MRTRTKSDGGAWAAFASDLRTGLANCSVEIISSVCPLKPLGPLGFTPLRHILAYSRPERNGALNVQLQFELALAAHVSLLTKLCSPILFRLCVTLRARRETSVVLDPVRSGNYPHSNSAFIYHYLARSLHSPLLILDNKISNLPASAAVLQSSGTLITATVRRQKKTGLVFRCH
jgi:hypothetical protein